MAIYQDYFETYVIGQSPPFGFLFNKPFSNAHIIDGGIDGGKCVQGPLRYDDGNFYSSFTVQTAFNDQTAFFNQPIVVGLGLAIFLNSPSELFRVVIETDGTLSIRNSNDSLVANSGDFSVHHNAWYTLQVNATAFDVSGTVHITVSAAVDGEVIFSGITFATLTATSSLVGNAAQFRFVDIDESFNDSFTFDSLQTMPSYERPNFPAPPVVRVSQGIIEATNLHTDANIRVSQGVVEIPELPDFAKIRVSMGIIELLQGHVIPPGLSIACPVTNTGVVGTPYTGAVTASGGTPPYTFALVGGTFPPGLTLHADGTITGTPTAAGNYSYQVKVTDSLGAVVQTTCSFAIGTTPPPPPPPPPEPVICGIGCGPKLYFWEPSYLDRPEDTYLRATDWDNAGYDGAKFLQGFLLTADTEGVIRTIRVEGDQTPVEEFSVLHTGEQTIAYSFTHPAIYSLIRLIGDDADFWRLFKVKWIFEPAPNLANFWETQGTSHDMAGWQFLKDGYIAHISIADLLLTITVDGVQFVYTIPNSGGVYKKDYILFKLNTLGKALKGKLFTYRIETTDLTKPFRLFVRDSEVRVHGWSGGDYVVKQPFGDLSRIYGARI